MKFTTILCSAAALAAVLVMTAAAQDKKPADPPKAKPPAAAPASAPKPAAGAPAMPEPKPGPEHANLAKDAGTWEATVTHYGGDKPQVTKGTETRKMVGSFWLVSDFTGEMNGMPYTGHGTSGYDQNKKKYVGTWVDSMNPALCVMEGTYDEATKTTTMKSMINMMGKDVPATMTCEHKDADTEIFKMNMPGPDGKDTTMMMIEYKRKK